MLWRQTQENGLPAWRCVSPGPGGSLILEYKGEYTLRINGHFEGRWEDLKRAKKHAMGVVGESYAPKEG